MGRKGFYSLLSFHSAALQSHQKLGSAAAATGSQETKSSNIVIPLIMIETGSCHDPFSFFLLPLQTSLWPCCCPMGEEEGRKPNDVANAAELTIHFHVCLQLAAGRGKGPSALLCISVSLPDDFQFGCFFFRAAPRMIK